MASGHSAVFGSIILFSSFFFPFPKVCSVGFYGWASFLLISLLYVIFHEFYWLFTRGYCVYLYVCVLGHCVSISA